jgi:hypothetical protein
LLQALCKRCKSGLTFKIVRGQVHKHADAPLSVGLLRVSCKRPRCRAAKRDN